MARPTLPSVGDPGPGYATTLNNAINDVSDRADQALAAAVGIPGVVQVDSFAGANDAAKMTAAMSYAAAQTYKPWLMLPSRTFDTGSTGFNMYDGMKITGSGVYEAPKNQEININVLTGTWKTSCGTGASSLLRASTTVKSVNVSNVAFWAGGNGSQIFRASGGNGCYPSTFHNLALYGGPYFFGNPAEKFLTTQMVFSGHWQVAAFADTPFTLGGSDSSLWMSGYINLNTGPLADFPGNGKPAIDFQDFGKSNVGFVYLTNEGDWVGVKISNGDSTRNLNFYGGMYEGRSQTNVATRTTMQINGGTSNFYGCYWGQVSGSSGNVQGVVQQTGGQANFYGGQYYRGSGTAASFPFLYQTGGTAQFYGTPQPEYVGEQIRVRWASGTTQTMPVHANLAFPQAAQSVAAAATDAASTQTLANSLRTALINLGYAV